MALPVAIGDKELADLPSDRYDAPDNFEEPPEGTMSGFIALTKLCKIAGRVAQVLYRPSNGRSVADASWAVSQQNTINKLDKTLKDWLVNEVVSEMSYGYRPTMADYLEIACQIQRPIVNCSTDPVGLGGSVKRLLRSPVDTSPKLLAVQPGLPSTSSAIQLAVLVPLGGSR